MTSDPAPTNSLVIEQEPTDPALKFLKKYKSRVDMWVKAHPKSDLPIVNSPDGPRWLNRAERRRLLKSK